MTAVTAKEAVGDLYDIDSMKHAQRMTWRAIEQMGVLIKPGMRESEARELGKKILTDLGTQRIWHPLLIRFGANTLKTFKQASEGDPVLGEDDIFFVDMGAVWQGHEGDAGMTFTTGNDPEMATCAAAAKTLFTRVEHYWKAHKTPGQALYTFAQEQAVEMGWELNLNIKGHRVSDFPHAIYRGGNLGDFETTPGAGLWILEIQIAHPSKPYGAFFEDLLI
ncbi:M24 family metallopeptidase [Pseudomonas sp. 10B1]|uniref:M24 family metallopeptidase n=1 Tax=unclassified Pseudomonas TaxID=196821 RepID=UPI002AB4E5DF|nr:MULTISPECIES: M24 family metallopeptidase [unclassified Pseudomonas]MDY7560866.1 M24 family metallopeptidase [Pseudomonas sp. AB6]MEA9976466.1 M24 family metallopeptidase [Pseudomonas sp. RTS4]MEA9996183.1 M24 family metallopeptidase [Pseudomonas sp. AA4]MEB0088931.1 M24 family metallopeptidase [Pseudomonas sp. RTI1]MEB0128041.1 M24 family metallopeptidase [Pseudomonas sp. CCC1.2]